MMSIHEIQQLSTPAEQASNAASAIDEGDVFLQSQDAEDDEEEPLQQNMASLDLADVFDIPPASPSQEPEGCSSPHQHDGDATSSSPSNSSSLFDVALHQDSRDLLRRRKKEQARKSPHLSSAFGQRTSSTLDESSISSDDSSSGSDFEDEDDGDILLCSLQNDSLKLMRINGIKRRATWSNARTQYNNDDDDDDDDDDDLSVEPLHNDSLSLLKSLVSRPSATSIFHRSLSDTDLAAVGLHKDSLAMLLGKKDKTTTSEERRAMMKAFLDQLDGEHDDTEDISSSNNGSSSSILDALHSRDSLSELSGVHHAPRRSSLRD